MLRMLMMLRMRLMRDGEEEAVDADVDNDGVDAEQNHDNRVNNN